ncbi:MAG: PKD domain-containing protein [Candidatus Omnitrophica bacterium]|nr:PKD domain-containing protein [Candidatus Omnitrophota bacterium]
MKKILSIMVILAVISAPAIAFAYNVPQDSSRVEYFYVFGPEGSQEYGAEDHELVLFVDLSEEETRNVVIAVYDPNTGGRKDWRENTANPWDTLTEFAVYGNKLLDKEQFGEEGYDREYFQFGPYSKEQGEKVDNFYRFRLEVKAIQGDDANLFKVKISPDSSEAFSTNITFRLLSDKGERMYFYPKITADTQKLIVENYDIDIDGGTSQLFDPVFNRRYFINDSESGEWRQTIVPLRSGTSRQLRYTITKAEQRQAHAGLRIKDENGNLLPIYFRQLKNQVVVQEQKQTQELTRDIWCKKVRFDATGSHDPDNQKLSFLWDFGDGNTSDQPVVTHEYEKGGEYNVTLTVRDDSGLICDTAVISQLIKVNTPPVASFGAPSVACVGEDVIFDARTTKDNTSDQLTYTWDFGDCTSAQGSQVINVFKKAGTYKVTLIVDDNAGSSCSKDAVTKMINVNTSPIANAGNDIDLCFASGEEYKVEFDGSASQDRDYDQLTYQWDFGDGTTSPSKKTTHIYQKGGVYTAKLFVNDRCGSSCSSDVDLIKIRLNKPPVADAGENITTCADNTVLLDASYSYDEDGDELTYKWDFGNGITETGVQVEAKYNRGGTYLARLIIDDGKNSNCSAATDHVNILVNSKPIVTLTKGNASCIGERINFDASSSRDPDGDTLTYTWDFGDGTIVEGGSSIFHTYEKGGHYTVKISADDARGTPCSVGSDATRININTPPVANAGPNLVCCAGTETAFDCSASYDPDGDNLNYFWDFGDGASARGVKVSHAYSRSGTYKVKLVVNDGRDGACSTAIDSFMATANEKPTAIMKITQTAFRE